MQIVTLLVTEDEMIGWHHQPMDVSLSKLREMTGAKDRKPGVPQSMRSQNQAGLSN